MKKHYFSSLIVVCAFCLTILPAQAYKLSNFTDSAKRDLPVIDKVVPQKPQRAFQASIEKIRIYPNPVNESGVLTVMVPANMGELNISLYNTVGKVIHTFKSSDKKIDITAPGTSGIYLLRFVEKQKVVAVEKIVVKN